MADPLDIFSLSASDFNAYLQEAAQYSAPSQIDFLRNEYVKRNSFSGLLDTSGEAGLEGKNVSSMLPIAGPAGMSLFDAAKGGKLQTRFKDYITDALGALVGGVENPGMAAKGLLTDDEMLGAAMQTAGTAMLGGGAAVNTMRPSGDGLLASNMPIGTKVYRQDSLTPNLPGEGAVYYSPNKSYTENYAGEGRTLKTSTVPENTVDIQTPEGRSQVVNWMQGEYNKFAKLSDDLELPRISGELKYIKDILNKENISAPDVAQAMANLTLIYNRQTGNQNSSAAEKQFLDNVGADAITMVESDGSPSLAFRFAPAANANASVGALVLSQHARAKPELADILAQNGVDPANINAAPIQRVQAALETATARQILDPRSANSILQGFAQPELEDFYANASKSAGAAGLLASDASKMTKPELDPLGYQNTKMDKPLSEVEVQRTDLGVNLPRKEADIEGLLGKIALPFFGDKSSGGLEITGIDDMKFDKSVITEAGADFMVGPAAQADGSIWASAQNIVKRLRDEAIKKANNEEKDVVGVTIGMAPDAVDFTNFAAATMAEMVKLAPIKKKDAKLFDAAMKNSVDPNWPGILNPDLRDYVEKAAPDIRKTFIRLMDTSPAQKMGFPSPAKMRLAVTDPDQIQSPSGTAGMALGEIDTSSGLLKTPAVPHSTYNTQLKGKYLGGIPRVHQGLLFRDTYNDMKNKVTKKGQPFSDSHKTYAMKTQLPGQEFTQEIVDYLMQLRESQR